MPESMEKLMAMEIYFNILIVTVRIQNDTSGHVKNYRVIFAVYRFFCPGTNIHARDNKADCDVVVMLNLLPIFLKFILKFFCHVYSFLFFFCFSADPVVMKTGPVCTELLKAIFLLKVVLWTQ